ncbi:nuclear transport factor 2 family protein [Hydrogenophaga palleronii]|uniref:nuclear transport factor 2 family protein n=1 Tax=Hydrogenophaga palleronii TaxID=65655 RepID=UPI000B2F6194|nr:nuclear transport factor 2 family protein [Hydrogenophaga palleronii]
MPSPSPLSVHEAPAELQALHRRALQTLVVPDAAFTDALVDADFRFTGSDGAWLDRTDYLALRCAPVLRSAACNGISVRRYGPVALLQGTLLQTPPSGGGAPTRCRCTDVYLQRDSAWRLVNSQHTPVQDDVPTVPPPGVAPAHAPWTGQDPVGPTLLLLQALNEQYVQAYRAADVAWYAAHFAPEYNAVQDDGTLSDRAAALARFAQGSYATHMRSFPVGRVSVRCFHDVALIHAENAYTLKDGRQGVARYTDIWHRQPGGRWLCVSAHITEQRAPA